MANIERAPSSIGENNGQNSDKRVLGIWSASSMVVGVMIGSGIFFLPSLVMGYSGSVGMFLLTWILCGIVAFFGGLCWVELGLTFPKNGGEYILIKETLGPIPAFAIIWVRLIIVIPASMAIGRLAIANYILQPIFPDCTNREDLVPVLKLIALVCVTFECLMNILSATWTARLVVIITLCKVLTLLIVVGMGVYGFTQGTTNSFTSVFDGTTSDLGSISLGLQSCLWAYEGWDMLVDMTEEVKKPKKTLPLAILGSISMVTLIYMAVNISYLAILTPQEMKQSPAAAATVVKKIFGPSVGWIVPVLVSVSVFGSSFGSTFGAGRVLYSAAREGHLPQFLAMIHTIRGTPVPVYIFVWVVVFIMIISPQSSIQTLIRLLSTAEWIVYAVTVVGLLWTRYKRPGINRPFKLPIIVPVLFLFICLYLIITPFIKAPIETSISLLPALFGLPVYYFLVYRKLTPRCILNILDWLTYKCQAVLNVRLSNDKLNNY